MNRTDTATLTGTRAEISDTAISSRRSKEQQSYRSMDSDDLRASTTRGSSRPMGGGLETSRIQEI